MATCDEQSRDVSASEARRPLFHECRTIRGNDNPAFLKLREEVAKPFAPRLADRLEHDVEWPIIGADEVTEQVKFASVEMRADLHAWYNLNRIACGGDRFRESGKCVVISDGDRAELCLSGQCDNLPWRVLAVAGGGVGV